MCIRDSVGRLLADAEDRGDGVEEPAHAGRAHRFELQALAHELPPRPRHRQARSFEMNCSDAPRLADRRLSSWERYGLEVRQALEPVEVAAQQLAAPQRSVG